MRNLLKSAGFVLYFLIAQCLATVGFIVYKIYADKEWMNALCNTLETSGAMSTEYLKLICEICLPMLVIADIIIIIPLICRTIVKREIFLRKPSVLCMLNMISLGLLLNFNVSTIITILPQSAVTSKYDSLMEMAMNGGILLSVLSSAILAPIAEELIFRYGICGVAYRKNWKFGMILSAAMFGVMHMNPIQSTYAFLMGLVLAYVYIKSDYNLLISIVHQIVIIGIDVAAFSRIIDIGWRAACMPIGIANSFEGGVNSSGAKFFKGFVASVISGVVMVIICAIGFSLSAALLSSQAASLATKFVHKGAMTLIAEVIAVEFATMGAAIAAPTKTKELFN